MNYIYSELNEYFTESHNFTDVIDIGITSACSHDSHHC